MPPINISTNPATNPKINTTSPSACTVFTPVDPGSNQPDAAINTPLRFAPMPTATSQKHPENAALIRRPPSGKNISNGIAQMPTQPPRLNAGPVPLPDGITMAAPAALRAGLRSLVSRPIAALLGLAPMAPIAAIALVDGLARQPTLHTLGFLATSVLIGPATIGCWRHYLRVADGTRPSPADWFAGYRFTAIALVANALRFAAFVIAIVPAVLILTVYLFVSGSPVTEGGPPAPADVVAFLLIGTPAALGIIAIKCLTYAFEILLADGKTTRLIHGLDAAIRIAWRNIRPIAGIFGTIGLVAIPLVALAYVAIPLLPLTTAAPTLPPDHPFAASLPNAAAIDQALKISCIPLLPWIFLTLAHAHRQALPAD